MGLLKDIDKDRVVQTIGLASVSNTRSIEVQIQPMLRKYIKPLIGQAIIDYLDEEFDDIILDDTSLDFQLLSLFEQSLYYFVANKMSDRSAVQHTTAGITTQKTENSVPASNQLIHNLKKNYLESAYDALEDLLSLLNANAEIFEEYGTSQEYQFNKSFFISDAKTFSDNYQIIKRNQTYLHLRPAMKDVEELIIEAAIGTPYFSELKEKILNDELTEPDESALRLIRKIVAFYTIHDACMQDWVAYTPDGVVFKEWVGSVTDGSVKITVAQAEQISLKISHAKQSAEHHLNRLIELLNSKPDDYETYTAWKAEVSPPEENNCDPFTKRMGCKDINSGIFW